VIFASVRNESWITNVLPVGPTGRCTSSAKLIIQRFRVHRVNLATAYADIKECAITKEFCMMQSICASSYN